MGDEIYRPLIEDIVWSYSNIETFNDCRYRWFLKYISRYKSADKFYASYGLFMHTLLEKYYRGEMSKDEMLQTFLKDFSKEVKGRRPKSSIVQKYIKCGAEYLKNFTPFEYKTISVEEKINFNIDDDIKFVVRIDFIGQDDEGEYVVIDNKSRDLKPRSNRKKPTVKDKELDSMLRQLYVYAGAVKYKYGKFPKYLCFNCFKSGVFIKEEFDEEKYNETIDWVKSNVAEIKETEDFYPNKEYFSCRYICGMSHLCCYNDTDERKW